MTEFKSISRPASTSADDRRAYVDTVARRNVLTSIQTIIQQSDTLSKLVREGKVAIVGGMYDVATGEIQFL